MRTSHKSTRFVLTIALIAASVAGITSTMLVNSNENAFATKKAFAQQPTSAHKIALIDMAHLFNEYSKFKQLRDQLKSEIEKKDEQAKAMQTEMQTLGAQLKGGTLKPGSADYEKIETKILNLKSQFDIFKAKAQRDFVLRESEIYKEVYMEVAKAVDQYATFYKYTAVLRFSRKKVQEQDNPRELIKNMNNQVVWSDPNADITEEVLKYLNQRYQKSGGIQSATQPGTIRK